MRHLVVFFFFSTTSSVTALFRKQNELKIRRPLIGTPWGSTALVEDAAHHCRERFIAQRGHP